MGGGGGDGKSVPRLRNSFSAFINENAVLKINC